MNTGYVVVLFFSISMVLMLLAPGQYQNAYMQKYAENQIAGDDFGMDDVFQMIVDYAFSWNGFFTGAASVFTFVASGFNLLAVVPFALLFIFLDFFIFPSAWITNSGLPVEIQVVILGFLTVTKVMIIITFLRTGD